MIDLLLAKGADINIRIDKKSGYTILMKLAANETLEREKADNTLELVQFLIERGANVFLKGNDNKSVFEIIQNSKNSEAFLKILNNTNHSVFFNTINNESEPSESARLQGDSGKSGFFGSVSALGKKAFKDAKVKDILMEDSTYKLNCCVIF